MPRPILAPARRIVPETSAPAISAPKATAQLAAATSWPWPRIRANAQARPDRRGVGVVLTVEVDRYLHEALQARVARGESRTIQSAVLAALRAFLRNGGRHGS